VIAGFIVAVLAASLLVLLIGWLSR